MSANNAVVGAVRANLGLDSAAFEKGIDRATAKFDAFGSKLKKMGAAMVAGFSLHKGVEALGRVQESIDKISKMSVKFGIPTEELSRLAFAADLSGVSLESLATGVTKLSKELSEMATNTTGSGARALRALGISFKDAAGHVKSIETIMGEVADKFAGFADGPNKAALALALFGKSGVDLVPLLNEGSKKIAEMKKEADALGVTISTKTGKDTEQFRDNLTKLGYAKDGLIKKINEGLLPALNHLTEGLTSFLKDGDRVTRWADNVAAAFEKVAKFSILVGAGWDKVTTMMSGFGRMATDPLNFAKHRQETLEELWKIHGAMEKQLARFDDIKRKVGDVSLDFPGSPTTPQPKPDAPALAAAKDKLDEFNRSMTERIEKLKLEAQLLGATAEQQAIANEKMALDNFLRKEKLRLTPEQTRAMEENIAALGRVAAQTDAAKRAWQSFVDVQEAFRNVFNSSIDRMIDGTFKLKDAIGDLLRALAKLLANSAFTSLFGGGGQKGVWDIAGGLGSIFGGGKAVGGPVDPSKMYMVGEKGPEMFVPRTAGNIVPNDQLGGMGGVSMPITINAQGADPAGLARVEAEVRALRNEVPGMVISSFQNARARRLLR